MIFLDYDWTRFFESIKRMVNKVLLFILCQSLYRRKSECMSVTAVLRQGGEIKCLLNSGE